MVGKEKERECDHDEVGREEERECGPHPHWVGRGGSGGMEVEGLSM